jgi:predicted 3-demethylubiquinone-9 3-methyltransferase (glyoxalase superfamily)
MPKIIPFPWFDGRAGEAAKFHPAVFGNARIVDVMSYGEAGPGPGAIMSAIFELEGQTFIAVNGGPMFRFSPAVSFFVALEAHAINRRRSKATSRRRRTPAEWRTG